MLPAIVVDVLDAGFLTDRGTVLHFDGQRVIAQLEGRGKEATTTNKPVGLLQLKRHTGCHLFPLVLGPVALRPGKEKGGIRYSNGRRTIHDSLSCRPHFECTVRTPILRPILAWVVGNSPSFRSAPGANDVVRVIASFLPRSQGKKLYVFPVINPMVAKDCKVPSLSESPAHLLSHPDAAPVPDEAQNHHQHHHPPHGFADRGQTRPAPCSSAQRGRRKGDKRCASQTPSPRVVRNGSGGGGGGGARVNSPSPSAGLFQRSPRRSVLSGAPAAAAQVSPQTPLRSSQQGGAPVAAAAAAAAAGAPGIGGVGSMAAAPGTPTTPPASHSRTRYRSPSAKAQRCPSPTVHINVTSPSAFARKQLFNDPSPRRRAFR
eukprot:gene7719-11854_t